MRLVHTLTCNDLGRLLADIRRRLFAGDFLD
jgi:hypothetical protein